jgi:tRNA A37 threonylcarbamoyltransferase TsaD
MLTIHSDQMRSFFDTCVDGIIQLIKEQISQVERKGKRIKTIFLVGGFGESPYLREELESSMRLRKINLKRPDTSWTAVVR